MKENQKLSSFLLLRLGRIIDEKLGRFHAKHADLKVTGIIGILIRAKNLGILKELKPLLYELVEKNVWISETLIDTVLKHTGEQ